MRGKPAAVRGMARIGSRDGGWLSRIERPATCPPSPFWERGRGEGGVCRGKINRRDLYRANMMLMTLLGFLWAVLLLIAIIAWSDPTCFAKMFRFVRRPVYAL